MYKLCEIHLSFSNIKPHYTSARTDDHLQSILMTEDTLNSNEAKCYSSKQNFVLFIRRPLLPKSYTIALYFDFISGISEKFIFSFAFKYPHKNPQCASWPQRLNYLLVYHLQESSQPLLKWVTCRDLSCRMWQGRNISFSIQSPAPHGRSLVTDQPVYEAGQDDEPE